MKNLRIKKYVCGTFLASALLMVGCQTDEAVDEWGKPVSCLVMQAMSHFY